MVAASGVTKPRPLGNPVFRFESIRMPAEWWLPRVDNDARVGEQSVVVWKFVRCRPSPARESMLGGGEAATGSGHHGTDSSWVRPVVP